MAVISGQHATLCHRYHWTPAPPWCVWTFSCLFHILCYWGTTEWEINMEMWCCYHLKCEKGWNFLFLFSTAHKASSMELLNYHRKLQPSLVIVCAISTNVVQNMGVKWTNLPNQHLQHYLGFPSWSNLPSSNLEWWHTKIPTRKWIIRWTVW